MATRKDKVQIVVGAKDKTGKVLSGIKSQLLAVGGAYAAFAAGKEIIGESIVKAANYEATITSLESVVTATGRNINEVYAEMETHLGGLADKSQIAEGFLKGMTTELSAQQVSKLTSAVKDASIAMGEDFGVQLPLIIKAIKQLNPAILDNIGVTVRLDEVNKKIRDGFYGAGTAITEYTQQNAIFQEVLKQTAKFQGQEEKLLTTTKGAWQQLSTEWSNAQLAIGKVFTENEALAGSISAVTSVVKGVTEAVNWFAQITGETKTATYELTTNFGNAADNLVSLNRALDEGGLSLLDYRDKMIGTLQALEKGADENVVNAKQMFEEIIKNSRTMSDVQATILAGFLKGDITADTFGEIQNMFIAHNEELKRLARIGSKDIETEYAIDWAQWRKDNLVIEDVSGPMEQMGKLLREHLIKGFILPGGKGGLATLLESFGFKQEDIERFLEPMKAATEEAIARVMEADNKMAAHRVSVREKMTAASREGEEEEFADISEYAEKQFELLNLKLQWVRDIADQEKELREVGLSEEEAARLVGYGLEYEQRLEQDERLIELARARAALEQGVSLEQLAQMDTAYRKTYQKAERYVTNYTRRVGADMRSFIHQAVADTDRGVNSMGEIWNELGKSVRSVIVDMMLDALAQLTSSILSKVIPALIKEGLIVLGLTKKEVALAAAKSAVNPASAPGRIAAAGITMASLGGMLLAFDDPINDEIAMKHGRDYAKFFMRGARDSFGSPRFGLDVTQAIGQATTVPAGGGGGLTVIFNAPVTDEEFVQQTIVPIIEQAAIDGGSRLLIDADTVTGDASVNIG